jgi:hypothetical protein
MISKCRISTTIILLFFLSFCIIIDQSYTSPFVQKLSYKNAKTSMELQKRYIILLFFITVFSIGYDYGNSLRDRRVLKQEEDNQRLLDDSNDK